MLSTAANNGAQPRSHSDPPNDDFLFDGQLPQWAARGMSLEEWVTAQSPMRPLTADHEIAFQHQLVRSAPLVVPSLWTCFAGVPLEIGGKTSLLTFAQRALASDGYRWATAANLDFLVRALWSREFRQLLGLAHHVTIDGAWVGRILRAAGRPFHAGCSLSSGIYDVAHLAAEEGASLYLLGGRGDTALRSATILKSQFPRLDIAGVDDSYFDLDDTLQCSQVVNRIRDSRAELLFVALGSPKQEKFAEQWGSRSGVRLAICMGGAFDFVSGERPRAPVWIQRAGMEWAFRMFQDLGHLGPRYLRDILALPQIIAEVLRTRRESF